MREIIYQGDMGRADSNLESKSHLPHHFVKTNSKLTKILSPSEIGVNPDTTPKPIEDREEFRDWLSAQFTSKEYVRNIVFKAKEWYLAIYDHKELAKLKAFSAPTRSRILKPLANRAKFEESYETWQSTMKNATSFGVFESARLFKKEHGSYFKCAGDFFLALETSQA